MKTDIMILLAVCAIFLIIVLRNTEKNEGFAENNTTKCDNSGKDINNPVRSIRSKVYGAAINVCPAKSTDCSIGTIDSDYLVLIKKGNVDLALQSNADGSFHLDNPNGDSTKQMWIIKKISTKADLIKLNNNLSIANLSEVSTPYHVIIAKDSLNSETGVLALEYSKGTISVTPLHDYMDQRWDVYYTPITNNSINVMPNKGSNAIFPSEFNPTTGGYSFQTQQGNLLNLQQNIDSSTLKSLNEVISLLKAQDKTSKPSEHSFSDGPISIKVHLGEAATNTLGLKGDSFTDVNKNDVNSLLSRYEQKTEKNKLQEELNNQIAGTKCTAPNLNNYVHKSKTASCYGCSF